MTCAAVPSVLQNGVVVYQNVKNAHELEWIPVAAPVTVGTSAEKMYTAVMLQRDPQTQRLYLHDAITEKELDIRGTEHLKTHRGSDTTNSELYTADILRNALNVKSEQLSAGRSIEEMTGEDLSNVGHMKEEAFPKLTALPETPALCGGMLLRTVYPPPTEMSTRKSFPPAGASMRWRERMRTHGAAWIRGGSRRRTACSDVTPAAQHT